MSSKWIDFNWAVRNDLQELIAYLLVSTISFTLSILQCSRPAAINLESSLSKEREKKSWLNHVSPKTWRPHSTEPAIPNHHCHHTVFLKQQPMYFQKVSYASSSCSSSDIPHRNNPSSNLNTKCLSTLFSGQSVALEFVKVITWLSINYSQIQRQQLCSVPVWNLSGCKYLHASEFIRKVS